VIEVEPDATSFHRVARALDAGFETALQAAVAEVRGAILGMPSGGFAHAGEPLRAAVAAHIETDVRIGRRSGSARIRALKRGMPRGFHNAPKRLNARRGWRHPLWGRDQWTQQVGEPGWFDDTLARGRPRYQRVAAHALQQVERRISRRV
jgi:hypothetical protein